LTDAVPQRIIGQARYYRSLVLLDKIINIIVPPVNTYNTIQYNIRLLEAVRTQRRTIIEREKYVENENVKMVHNE